MSEVINLARELQTMQPGDVIRDERVKSQFISVYNSIFQEGGEAAYEREAIYFNRQLREKEKLRKCTGTSVFYSFIDLAVRGLTLEPGTQALCYLLPSTNKAGTREGKDIYENICTLTISGYGELVLRARAGQILYADNPVIVYEGDTFRFGERDGHKVLDYLSCYPRSNNHIIACFLKITRPDSSVDYSVMTETDWARLRNYSEKKNTYIDQHGQRVSRANALYNANDGQIDTGFLMAKCIKHAFRTYPKINIGRGTALETELLEGPSDSDPYAGVEQEQHQESFAPAPDTAAGITIDPSTQNDNDGTF